MVKTKKRCDASHQASVSLTFLSQFDVYYYEATATWNLLVLWNKNIKHTMNLFMRVSSNR